MAGEGHDNYPASAPEDGPAAHEDEHEHEGSFATGEEVIEHHPEERSKGDFAKGQEEEDRP